MSILPTRPRRTRHPLQALTLSSNLMDVLPDAAVSGLKALQVRMGLAEPGVGVNVEPIP